MTASNPGSGRALSFCGHITSLQDCAAAVEFAIKSFGHLEILVNNARVAGASGTAVDVDMTEWAKSMETNVTSMAQMSKYAIPEMTNNDGEIKGGIANMSSITGAVAFLAGPQAPWMTGVILPVDAGTTEAVGIGMTKSASVNG